MSAQQLCICRAEKAHRAQPLHPLAGLHDAHGRRTHGHQVVGVKGLEVGRHLLDPGLDVLVAADSLAARLIDQVPRQDGRVRAVNLWATVRLIRTDAKR